VPPRRKEDTAGEWNSIRFMFTRHIPVFPHNNPIRNYNQLKLTFSSPKAPIHDRRSERIQQQSHLRLHHRNRHFSPPLIRIVISRHEHRGYSEQHYKAGSLLVDFYPCYGEPSFFAVGRYLDEEED
jgi:hypothetical protein